MGIRGELFTTEITLDNRTYFFNIKENRTGDVFLQVVESKNSDGSGFDRHAIVVFEEDMQKFLQGLETSLKFIEKNRKAKAKEIAGTPAPGKKRIIRKSSDSTGATGARTERTKSFDPSSPKPARTTPRRVTVISRKDQKKD